MEWKAGGKNIAKDEERGREGGGGEGQSTTISADRLLPIYIHMYDISPERNPDAANRIIAGLYRLIWPRVFLSLIGAWKS
jgi:hypothetical protein